MHKQEYIPIDIFCQQHAVDSSLIKSLQAYGLIELVRIDETDCFIESQLCEVEKCIRLYIDLDINLEGIDVITHLLMRIKEMQTEMQYLKNRLSRYEYINESR